MRILILVLVVGGALFWFLSKPNKTLPFAIPEGDANLGAYVATSSGCPSCHGADYSGGEAIYSPFGTFYAPNITPAVYDVSAETFALALLNGVGQNGQHLYPAFPYSTYRQMTAQDVADLYAFLRSLPPVDVASKTNELPFYAKWQRSLGIWKQLRPTPPEVVSRGGYLVEVLGHCQECHTPRNLIGQLKYNHAFEGGDIYGASGKVIGHSSNLKSGDVANWSSDEIESYLSDGFTPEYDTAGGAMVEVIENNTAKLRPDDRKAIAQYLVDIRSE